MSISLPKSSDVDLESNEFATRTSFIQNQRRSHQCQKLITSSESRKIFQKRSLCFWRSMRGTLQSRYAKRQFIRYSTLKITRISSQSLRHTYCLGSERSSDRKQLHLILILLQVFSTEIQLDLFMASLTIPRMTWTAMWFFSNTTACIGIT
jgi:hypothetical protein